MAVDLKVTINGEQKRSQAGEIRRGAQSKACLGDLSTVTCGVVHQIRARTVDCVLEGERAIASGLCRQAFVILRLRVMVGVALAALLLSEIPALACDTPAGKALAADARRATVWNWGWGATLGVSALAYAGLYQYTDSEDRRLAFGITVVKASLGSLNQIILPIRIEAASEDCADLDEKLKKARTIERKRHNWFAHSSGIVLNLAGTAYIGFATGNWLLAAQTSVLGIATGQLIIYTSPNKVRERGFGLSNLTLIPMLGADRSGLILGGVF